MARTARIAPAGIVYHVLNRGVGKTRLFRFRKDYEAFQRCLIETQAKVPIRLLGYCVMPTHWHLLLWPAKDGELARFMMRLTNMHVRRWLTAHDQVGRGHLYQGRYKSFAIENDKHLSNVDRYVHRNTLRANLVTRAEAWPWSGAGQAILPAALQVTLSDGPVKRRNHWIEWLNAAQTDAEEDAIRRCIREGRPYGSEWWLNRTMARLGWREPAKPGRPKKKR